MDVTLLLFALVFVASVVIARRPIGNPSVLGYLLGGIAIAWSWALGMKGYAYYLAIALVVSLVLDVLGLRVRVKQAQDDAEYQARSERY